MSWLERRWPMLRQSIELGRLRAREVLLGESHPETEARAPGVSPFRVLLKALRLPAGPAPD